MFITNAAVYFHNAYFRAKVALLVLAAINVLVFELTARRTVAAMGPGALGASARSSRRDACRWSSGSASSSTGRMIGFTTTRASLAEPAPVENLEDLLGLPADGGARRREQVDGGSRSDPP